MKYASYDGFNTLPVAGGLTVSNGRPQAAKPQRNSAKPNFVRHISHQPSAISHQPSAISHQPSAISHQPSAIIHTA